MSCIIRTMTILSVVIIGVPGAIGLLLVVVVALVLCMLVLTCALRKRKERMASKMEKDWVPRPHDSDDIISYHNPRIYDELDVK